MKSKQGELRMVRCEVRVKNEDLTEIERSKSRNGGVKSESIEMVGRRRSAW